MKKLREKTNLEICEENNIKYSFLTNFLEEKDTRAKIRATLEIISKVLCGTLGPYGSTTIIQDAQGRHFASKDGYDLMNRITFEDQGARTVLDLVRQLASNQVLTVGDGSTSAIVVANALYSALTAPEQIKSFEKVAAKDIIDILNDISDYIEEEIKKSASSLSSDLHELETIAMISTNNDRDAGKIIKEIYDKIGKDGFISTDVIDKKTKDTFEIKDGIEWRRGYIDSYFGDGFENGKVIFDKKPKIFITNSVLTQNDIRIFLADLLGKTCAGDNNDDLIIIANDFDEYVRTFFKTNRIKHKAIAGAKEMRFVVSDIDQVTRRSKNDLADLGIICGCKVYDKATDEIDYQMHPEKYLGTAEKVVVTEKYTQIIADYDGLDEEHKKARDFHLDEISKRAEELKKKEPNEMTMDEDAELSECLRRMSSLKSSTAIIHIGGKTLSERQTRERLFEDAIFACKSAIKYGYINGGNIMIPRILKRKSEDLAEILANKYSYLPLEVLDKNDENYGTSIKGFFRYFIKVVKDAFLESYRNVLNNSYLGDDEIEKIVNKCVEEDVFYNLKLHSFEDSKTTQVINSLATDTEILKTCISLIGILATSNQMITLSLNVKENVR